MRNSDWWDEKQQEAIIAHVTQEKEWFSVDWKSAEAEISGLTQPPVQGKDAKRATLQRQQSQQGKSSFKHRKTEIDFLEYLGLEEQENIFGSPGVGLGARQTSVASGGKGVSSSVRGT